MHVKFDIVDISHEDLPVNRAYLIFNKLEDKKTCLEQTRISRMCCTSKSVEIARLYRGETKLKVKQTTEPSNILWENLEITRCARRLRKSVSVLLAILVLIASITIIYLIKTYETTLPSDSYCADTEKINPDLTLQQAKQSYTTSDQIYCYCHSQSWTSITSDSKLTSYCSYFISKITTSLLLKFFSACGVVFINFILRYIFKRLSKFERVSNKTKEQLNIMIKVFVATFINTALIVLLVNANFRRIPVIYYIPYSDQVFTGQFADFTRDWYVNVGESVVFTMIVCIFSPHMIALVVFYPVYICKRRCCFKQYKTQSALNKVYAGPEFDLATRNSQVLNLIFTCYLYSSSIPFLNLIAATALFCLYWTDKCLVLRHYKKPPLLSYHLNSAAIKLLPVIIILHSMFAIYMYGSEDIFPTAVSEVAGQVVVRENGIYDRLFSVPGALNSFVIIITVLVSLLIFCYGKALVVCRKRNAKVEEETQNSQGSYKEEIETIKMHGLHTYRIIDNPEYHELVLSLNNTAKSIKTLRERIVEKKKSMNSRSIRWAVSIKK